MTRDRDTSDSTAVLEGATDGASRSLAAGDTTVRVKVPDDASDAEADAIATAVREHLVATGRLSDSDKTAETRRWINAHRLQGIEPEARALLDNTDADPWVAASRATQRW